MEKCVFQINDQTVGVTHPEHEKRKALSALEEKVFTFDRVFAEDCSQNDIYHVVSAHVKAAVRGYNTTIFAYGSTGSGKSHTMTGSKEAPGVIPRAITEIFSLIGTTTGQKDNDVFFYVRLSYVELYNNNFRNLLEFASKGLSAKGKLDTDESMTTSPTRPSPRKMEEVSPKSDKIEVRESRSDGVFLAGHNLRIPVTTAEEALQLISKGNKYRVVSATQCNDVSSRSHAILTLHVESESLAAGANPGDKAVVSELRLGKMHLVDLAGSERLALSGAEGGTLLETQNINLSLTALGDVLSALSRNTHASPTSKAGRRGSSTVVPVPYRNSKLTHLLKDSLGGNSKTIMIATIRTSMDYYQQTAVTLMYSSRAKNIKNKIHVNRNAIGDSGIQTVTREIERLRARLDERSNEFEMLRHTQLKDATENEALKVRLSQLKEANEREKKELESQMSHIIHSQAGQLASQQSKISTLQQSLQEELAVSQNRIAEQEQEIRWLKKALDDAAKHPPSERAAAADVQAPAERLQTQNTALSLDLDATGVGAGQIRRQFEEKVGEVGETEGRVAHLEARVAQLEAELAAEYQLVASLRAEAQGTGKTISALEKDKTKLRAKLERTITLFEQRTSATIDTVTATLQATDHKYQEAEARAQALTRDLAAATAGQETLRKCAEDLTSAEWHVGTLLADLADAREAHAADTHALQATVQSLQNALVQRDASLEQSAAHVVRVEADRRKEKEQMGALRNDHKQGLTELKSQFQLKVASMRAAHQAELATLADEHRREQQQSLRTLGQQQLDSKCELERALALAQSQQGLLVAMRDKEEQATRTGEEALTTAERRHQAEMAALQRAFEGQVEAARREAFEGQAELQRVQVAHRQLADELREANKKQAKMAKLAVGMVKEEARKEVDGLREAHEAQVQGAAERARQEVVRAQQEATDSQTRLEALKDEWSQAHASRIRELEASHRKACDDLHTSHQSQTKAAITALEEEYKNEIAVAARASQDALQQCLGDLECAEQHADDLKADLSALKTAHASEVQALVCGHHEQRESSLAALRSELEGAAAAAVAAGRRELAEAQREWQERRVGLEAARDALEQRVAHLQFELASRLAAAVEAERRLSYEYAAVVGARDGEAETALRQLRDELTGSFAATMQATQEAHKAALQATQEAHTARLKDTLTTHRTDLARIAEEYARCASKDEAHRATHRAELEGRLRREAAEALEVQKEQWEQQHTAAVALVAHEARQESTAQLQETTTQLQLRLQDTQTQLQGQLHDTQTQLQDAQMQLQDTQSQLQESERRSAEADSKAVAVEALLREAGGRLAAVQGQLDSYTEDHRRATEEFSASYETLDRALARVAQLEADQARDAEAAVDAVAELCAVRVAQAESLANRQRQYDEQVVALEESHRHALHTQLQAQLQAQLQTQQRDLHSTAAEWQEERQRLVSDRLEVEQRLRQELQAGAASAQDVEVAALTSAVAAAVAQVRVAEAQREEVGGRLAEALALGGLQASEVRALVQRVEQHAAQLVEAEGRWRDRHTRELAAAEGQHAEALRAALADAHDRHSRALHVADQRLQQVLQETSQQQQELSYSLASMRAHYEADRERSEGLSSPKFEALEARRREMLVQMESSNREKEEAFRAAKGGLAAAEQRLKDLEEAWLRRRAGTAAAAAAGASGSNSARSAVTDTGTTATTAASCETESSSETMSSSVCLS